jgi:hypothetical protein
MGTEDYKSDILIDYSGAEFKLAYQKFTDGCSKFTANYQQLRQRLRPAKTFQATFGKDGLRVS